MSLYDDYVTDNVMFLALTGYTQAEFAALVPAFEIAFFTRMQTYCLDGTPRTKRAYTEYKNSPLPTLEDKLFFILCYFKTYPIQAVQGATMARLLNAGIGTGVSRFTLTPGA